MSAAPDQGAPASDALAITGSLDALAEALKLYGAEHTAATASSQRLAALLKSPGQPLRLTVLPDAFRAGEDTVCHSAIARTLHTRGIATLELGHQPDPDALIRAVDALRQGEGPATDAWLERIDRVSRGSVRAHRLCVRDLALDDESAEQDAQSLGELASMIDAVHEPQIEDFDRAIGAVCNQAARAQKSPGAAESLRASLERMSPSTRQKLLDLGMDRPQAWSGAIPDLVTVWPEEELGDLLSTLESTDQGPSGASGLLFSRLGAMLSTSPELRHTLKEQLHERDEQATGPVLGAVAELLASPDCDAYDPEEYATALRKMATNAPTPSALLFSDPNDPDSIEVRATEIALEVAEEGEADPLHALTGIMARIGVLCARRRFGLLVRSVRLARHVESTRSAEPESVRVARSLIAGITTPRVIDVALQALSDPDASSGAAQLLEALGAPGALLVARQLANTPDTSQQAPRNWLAGAPRETIGTMVSELTGADLGPDSEDLLRVLAESLNESSVPWPSRLVIWGLGHDDPALVRGAIAGVGPSAPSALVPVLLSHLLSSEARRIGKGHYRAIIDALTRLTGGAITPDLARLLKDSAMRPARIRHGLCDELAAVLGDTTEPEARAATLVWRLSPLRAVVRRKEAA